MQSAHQEASVSAFLEEAGRYPFLSDEEIRCLTHKEKPNDVDTLVKHHLLLVYQVALTFGSCPLSLPDRLAEGMRGLWKAAKHYRVGKAPFHYYARLCVRKDILRAIDLKDRWHERQGRPFGCNKEHGRSLYRDCYNDRFNSKPLSAVVPASTSLRPDLVPVAHEVLREVAEHIQSIIDVIRRHSPRRSYQCFLFYFELRGTVRPPTLASYAKRLGYQGHSGVINGANSVWPLLEDQDVHHGGKDTFKEELETLEMLQVLTTTSVHFSTPKSRKAA